MLGRGRPRWGGVPKALPSPLCPSASWLPGWTQTLLGELGHCRGASAAAWEGVGLGLGRSWVALPGCGHRAGRRACGRAVGAEHRPGDGGGSPGPQLKGLGQRGGRSQPKGAGGAVSTSSLPRGLRT